MKRWNQVKSWAWTVLVIVILGPMYCFIIAEGLRLVVPALAQKVQVVIAQ